MSDYKRFVAYLYEYQNQAKGENRGFVRVEARNGTCQMGFQLRFFLSRKVPRLMSMASSAFRNLCLESQSESCTPDETESQAD